MSVGEDARGSSYQGPREAISRQRRAPQLRAVRGKAAHVSALARPDDTTRPRPARPTVGPSQDDLRQPFRAHPRLTGCSMRKNIMSRLGNACSASIQFPVAMCQYVSGSTKNRRFSAKIATENINTPNSNAAASVGMTKSSFFIGSSPFPGLRPQPQNPCMGSLQIILVAQGIGRELELQAAGKRTQTTSFSPLAAEDDLNCRCSQPASARGLWPARPISPRRLFGYALAVL